ncbi:MAG: DegT/DnrJ/EryC1/StrS family aminotransferase [Anaerolineales bacterium]|nr:DegT/DnrJ/EryC1/StrS family aminotransferase [Anaerolineales bacterium]MCB0005908.1 DegT/DnrJ/EryC1/StrS family aminotransferase [Anaerolineales bacterium]MCB0012728.1 DegT/DnrJ/EryC1/StrS family aminotransferase [Anaerolineales bacterium]
MRKAMAAAEVGDDVYGEDPTVNKLEETAADRLGKEAGLLVASGTQGNLVAILAHANRGEEAIVGQTYHTVTAEAGGMAVLGGIVPKFLPTDAEGRMALTDIEASIRVDNPHYPVSRLILLENTTGAAGGYPLEVEYMDAVADIGHQHGLSVHVDGARLFNAAVALGVPASRVVQAADSATFCLSKGLSAPVGSVLCGSAEFIHRARRIRKLLGGGMRQAGVFAAAGLVALDESIDRLAEDHARAKRLALGLSDIAGIDIDPERIKTNIVYFGLEDDAPVTGQDVVNFMREEAGIWLGLTGPRRFRAVTHYWIDDAAVDNFLGAMNAAMNRPVSAKSDQTTSFYG